MAAVQVVSATSAFQAEKVEEPIKTHHDLESSTVKETDHETESPVAAAAAEPIQEEQVIKETENVVAELPAGKSSAEAEVLAAEVEAKVVVVDLNHVEEPVGIETAKLAPEPEPAVVETLTKEAEPETKEVNAEEAESADAKICPEPVKQVTGKVEEDKAGDEAEGAVAEKSDA